MENLVMHWTVRYGSLKKAFIEADPEGEGAISIAEFTRMCQESKFTSAIHRLVMYLDSQKTGYINLELIDADTAADAAEFVGKEMEVKEDNLAVFKERRKAYFKETPTIGVMAGVEARDKAR